MKRMAIIAQIQGYEESEIGQKMIEDLRVFDKIQ